MASLLDIGRSAINAQREALNVTGQNIVNANTEGYRRRDATLTEVYGVQSELTALASQTGLGVKLGEIRRAYDVFLTESKRSATARFEASDAFVGKLEQLENLILPNDGDLGVVMTAFFDNLTQVAASPGDLAPREAALEMGQTVANAFNTTAGLLTSLMNGTAQEIGVKLVDVNRTLGALGVINGQLRSSNIGAAPPNSLLDERDRLLDSLAQKIPVNIKIGERLTAELRLGTSDAGPLILTGEDARPLSLVDGETGSIMFRVGSGQVVSQLETGALRGLVDAHGANRRALGELDILARDFSQKLNDQHAQGIDLDGQLGRELFAVSDFSVTPRASNQGDAQATIRLVPGLSDRLGALQMTFDGRRGQWQLTDDTGATLGVGRASIQIDGAVILVDGTPKDGDSFSIKPMSGEASRMSFLLTRGEEIAAASTIAIFPATTNKGSAVLTSTQETLPDSGVPALSSVLTNNLSPVAAKDFLRGGVVGSIPRGTESITLASLATQTTATVSAQKDADIRSLSLTVGGTTHSFSLDPTIIGNDAWASGAEIAKYLSLGVFRSDKDNVTIAQLGLTVSGSATGLTFASDGARALTGISASSASNTSLRTDLISGKPASDIRIFTREGRQVSGTPLAAAEIAQLLTTENGFSASAEYRSDYNAVSGSASYRGLSVTQRSSGVDPLESGLQSKTVSLTGLSGTAVGTISSNPAANSTTSQTISLRMNTGATGALAIPAGVDAAYVAQEANKAFAPVGVSAVARTAIRLSLDDVGSGTTQFDLTGVNDTALRITAQINNGDLSELVQAVNRRSDETGVTAELSLSGNAVTLVQRDGFDVVTTNISSGVALRASALDQMYNPLALDDTSDPSVSVSFDADLRFSGTVAFKSGSGFTLTTSGEGRSDAALVSAADPMKGGLVTQEHSNGGTLAALSYAVDSRIDGLSQNVDGTRVHAPSARFETVLTTADGTLFAAEVSANELSLGGMTGASVAQLTAQKLRAQAPVPTLQGAVFGSDAIPPIGASARFILAGAEYTLTRVDDGNPDRLTALDFVISGPETGRITPRVTQTDEGFSLSLIVADGQLAGAGPRPVAGSGAAVFGLSDSQVTQRLQGRSFDATEFSDGTYQMDVTVGGEAKSVVFQATSGVLTLQSVSDGLSADITLDDGLTSIALTSSEGADVMAVTPSEIATDLGFKLANAELSVENGKLLARSTDETVVNIKAGGSSAAGVYLHLSDLPDEELIVVMGSDGARRLSAEFEIGAPLTAKTRGPEKFRIEMMDDASGRVELFDVASGASIATRMSSGLARFNVAGQTLELAGFADTGDSFEFASGQRSAGDSRNLDEMLKLGQQGNGRRSFQDGFRSIAAGIGASLEAGRLTRASNEAVRDAAVASENALSGVNLDEEAAKLMAQQQAYQAAARILQTAREMFDTLIRIA
ncbi:MAG: flagellar hook-associated protein FlgK [Loktanella sp.]|nr:flagellar hook-associated protein FlgK [Loktanella sp.]